jgi:hypothetical protein
VERDRRYAHTDLERGRIVRRSGDPGHDYQGLAEVSSLFPRKRSPLIKELAEDLLHRPLDDAHALHAQLQTEE